VAERWLIAGALVSETAPLIARLAQKRATGRAVIGRGPGGRELVVLTIGVGPDKAARRVREALARWSCDRVLSVGTCGSLRDDLPIGAVITARGVMEATGSSEPVSPLVGVREAMITTVRRAVTTPELRAELAAAGAGVCEMEAAAVLAAAGDIPFGALKVVSDLAGAGSDPALAGNRALSMARFKARALLLSQRQLTPALWTVLARRPGS